MCPPWVWWVGDMKIEVALAPVVEDICEQEVNTPPHKSRHRYHHLEKENLYLWLKWDQWSLYLKLFKLCCFKILQFGHKNFSIVTFIFIEN